MLTQTFEYGMNSMMKNTITTNLRIPAEDLRQYRVVAAELGISFNDLVLDSLKTNTNTVSVRKNDLSTSKPKFEYSLDQLPQLPQLVHEAEVRGTYEVGSSKTVYKHHKDVGLSQEDSEIYE